MIGDDKVIEILRRVSQERAELLREVLAVLEGAGEFQLGPKGKHRDLPARIKKAIAGVD